MNEKYGRKVTEEEISQLVDAEILLADVNAFAQVIIFIYLFHAAAKVI